MQTTPNMKKILLDHLNKEPLYSIILLQLWMLKMLDDSIHSELYEDISHHSSSCQCLQERVGESLDRNVSPSPPLTKHPYSPIPPAHHIYSYHPYVLPNSLFDICGFFRPVVAYFLPL